MGLLRLLARASSDGSLRVGDRADLFRGIFEATPDLVAISRLADGKIVDVNPGLVLATGFTREQAIGSTALALGFFVNPSDRAALVDAVRSGGSLVDREVEIRRKDGTTFIGMFSVARVDVGGEPHVLAMIRDMSERKALEKMRTDLVAMLSHDIKNPLMIAREFAAMLGAEPDLAEDQRELLLRIEAAAQKALDLAVAFVDAMRIESGSFQVTLQRASLNTIVAESLRGQGALARERGIRIEPAFDPELPRLNLDPRMIDRVVVNLVSNAVKYAPEHSTVRVETAARNGEVVLAVRDQGPGVPAAERAALFQRYVQVAGTAKKESSGLGLFIVRTIAEAHGGRVDLECPPSGGSVFRVYLPA